ncbi:MAG TPA: hypothetical protein VHO70_13230 [Chitinispirillaceae bacterium]|nr:hypothetical protein [Chitinispirillaceae bacterium]
MKNLSLISLILACFISTAFSGSTKKVDFNGTWRAGTDGLILTFFAKDSLQVGSSSDESIKGYGVYKRTDSTFSATVKNGGVTMEMMYRYHSKGVDTVSAKALYFLVDGDSVEVPVDWIDMTRCKISQSAPVQPETKKETSNSKGKK